MEKINDVIFYHLDKAIKTYRQFAQKAIKDNGLNITIDQWLILRAINDNPGMSQRDIAGSAFKGEASVTRIIELLVKKDLLKRDFHSADRRKSELTVTGPTKKLLKEIENISMKNRAAALNGIEDHDLDTLKAVLIKITANCITK